MFLKFLLTLSFLTVFSWGASAQDNEHFRNLPEDQVANATEAVLTTIFLGDMSRSILYLAQLSEWYRRFLTGFAEQNECTKNALGPEIVEACLVAVKEEQDSIDNGSWANWFV